MSLKWRFDANALNEQNESEVLSGFRCEDYGYSESRKGAGNLLTVRPTELWKLKSNENSSDFAKAEVKKLLQL